MNDFEKTDKEAAEIKNSGVSDKPTETNAVVMTEQELNEVEVSGESLPSKPASNMMEHRNELIKKYHGGAESLIARITKEGKNNSEMMVLALVDELIRETDHLMGNELLASEQGDIRDSSVISAKRADVLEKAIKAVQTKQAFDKDNGLDINSPIVQIIFRFFMKKVKESFLLLGYSDEASDVFFQTLGSSLDNWRKELQQEIDDMQILNAETET